jgi:hypothetical protein
MQRTSVTALTLAVALAIAGCGGSSKSETASTGETGQALTRTELIAKADTICRRVSVERASMPKIKSRQDYGRVLPRVAAIEQAAVAELGKLAPPAPIVADWRQIVTADRTLAGDTGVFGQYVASGNTRGARALLRTAIEVQRPMAVTAKHDGLTDCTQFGS